MASTVKPIPEGYHAITPYLSIKGAAEAIAYYQRAFGAVELYRLGMPDGRVGHAELQIGDSRIMLADESDMADATAQSPRTLKSTSIGMVLYLKDVDAAFAQAVAAGGTIKRAVTTQFYGDRSGTLEDPFGHVWTLCTHVEDVSPEEMKKRMAALPHPG